MQDLFPTAKNVHIALDGYHIDLAFRMDWKEDRPRIPRYGYNDRKYTRTIPGRTLIQGFLVTNFIAPNYLGIIKEEEAHIISEKAQDKVRNLISELPDTTDLTNRKARAEALGALLFPPSEREAAEKDDLFPPLHVRNKDIDPNKEIKETMIRTFIEGERLLSVPAMASPLDLSSTYTMDVYYNDIGATPWHTTFYDVEFVSVSQSFSAAGAEGSSEPIYETYEFISNSRAGLTAGAPRSSENYAQPYLHGKRQEPKFSFTK